MSQPLMSFNKSAMGSTLLLPSPEQLMAAVNEADRLMPAPRTLGRALLLLRNADSSLADIVELISHDSALAADVLRCANSAYFARNTRIGAVAEAVQVIGFHETVRLVSLVATHATTNRDLGSYGIAADAFWTESLFNGLFIEALAKRSGGVDIGEAYTAGLLRFIGRVAANQALHAMGAGLFWDGHIPLAQWERENLGLTQAEVGGGLLRRWQFPEAIVLAVEMQDSTRVLDAPALPSVVSAMNFVAEVLPAGYGVPIGDSPGLKLGVGTMAHPFALEHQLTEEIVGEIHADVQASFAVIRDSLYR